MRLSFRADSVRECRRQWLRSERGRPLSPDLGVLSVGSRLSPHFLSQVRDVPTLQTLRISAQRTAYGALSPAGFLVALPLVLVALEIVHLARANLTNIAGPHSQIKCSTARASPIFKYRVSI